MESEQGPTEEDRSFTVGGVKRELMPEETEEEKAKREKELEEKRKERVKQRMANIEWEKPDKE